jgi:hypothetical protein
MEICFGFIGIIFIFVLDEGIFVLKERGVVRIGFKKRSGKWRRGRRLAWKRMASDRHNATSGQHH